MQTNLLNSREAKPSTKYFGNQTEVTVSYKVSFDNVLVTPCPNPPDLYLVT